MIAVEQFRVANRAVLKKKLDEVVRAGGEGLMLHLADAPNVTGRNDALLKLKPLQDTEAEVIEHMDAPRLPAFERALFGFAKPPSVVITTPNSEYNVRFPTLSAGKFRHPDHRFEWTRAEFHAWADGVAQRNGYSVRYAPIGVDDPEVGPPTQMAIFTRDAA